MDSQKLLISTCSFLEEANIYNINLIFIFVILLINIDTHNVVIYFIK
jgi:hypothetical protein